MLVVLIRNPVTQDLALLQIHLDTAATLVPSLYQNILRASGAFQELKYLAQQSALSLSLKMLHLIVEALVAVTLPEKIILE